MYESNNVMEEDDNNIWPILDFDLFPNGMISGLTLPEITTYLNKMEERNEIRNNNNYQQVEEQNNYPQTSNEHQTSRFAKPIGDDELRKRKIQSIPKGTTNRNNWSTNMYNKWAKARPITTSDDRSMRFAANVTELVALNTASLDYWLSKFIYEARKSDGSRFPGKSLCQITAGFNAFFRENNVRINLFQDIEFDNFRSSLDLACKESAKEGVGVSTKQAEVIDEAEEKRLWDNNALGGDTPQKLLDTLLYLNGLHFALRSGVEHRNLQIDQIEVIPPNDTRKYYALRYRENVSKTNSGGLKHLKIEPKCVTHIDTLSETNPTRSHALLLLKYLSLRPNDKKEFYLTPLQTVTCSSKVWFKSTPVGHNTLAKTVPRLCSTVGISGYKTNHSLRATCATRLYNEGVDEQAIMERTGHRSLSGIRPYKRTNEIQHFNTSVTIDNRSLTQHTTSGTSNARPTTSNTFNFVFNEGCTVTIINSKE